LLYNISGKIIESKNVWTRYGGFLPFEPERYRGEGFTPLVAEKTGPHKLLFKLEYLNPGGSFKDRGTALAVYYGFKMGFKKCVVDTSGNTGISVALYSKLYGLDSIIIMPREAPEGKKRVVRQLGGLIIETESEPGASEVIYDYINKPGSYYVAHLWSPIYIVSYATIAYEVYEDFGVPDYVIVPVGSGGLLLGVVYGFEKLREQGLIDKTPKVIAVQGYSAQPVYIALHGESSPGESSTLADGILVSNPPRIAEIASAVKRANGEVVLVGNSEIARAYRTLWELGFTVEPTSATVYAAYEKISGRVPENSNILLVLTGSGLKTLYQHA